MASGVPVVQPRLGAFPEILEKTRGGVLVNPDSVASVADGIYGLWKDPELAAELGRRGALGVREHFSAAQMAARALAAYQAIATARAHA
jgi:glycosyltransferase involved in cell wall biosynthesis